MRSRDHLQVAESACVEDNGSAVAYVETSTVQQLANGSRSRRCLDRAAAQLGFARKFRSSGLGNLLSMLHETLRHGTVLSLASTRVMALETAQWHAIGPALVLGHSTRKTECP